MAACRRFIVRDGQRLKVIGDAATALRGIHACQASRQRFGRTSPRQRHHLDALEQGLDRAAQLCPEFNLAGDGAFRRLTREPGIQDQGVGEFHGLAHAARVAKGYLVSSGGVQAYAETPLAGRKHPGGERNETGHSPRDLG